MPPAAAAAAAAIWSSSAGVHRAPLCPDFVGDTPMRNRPLLRLRLSSSWQFKRRPSTAKVVRPLVMFSVMAVPLRVSVGSRRSVRPLYTMMTSPRPTAQPIESVISEWPTQLTRQPSVAAAPRMPNPRMESCRSMKVAVRLIASLPLKISFEYSVHAQLAVVLNAFPFISTSTAVQQSWKWKPLAGL
jgi:hypothetical protein